MMYSILSHSIDGAIPYNQLDKDRVIYNIKNSGLIGRSGAAFSVYKKWNVFLNSDSDEKYLIINGHEGEPECTKDYHLLSKNLDVVLDGAMITAYVTGASKIIFAIKHEYEKFVKERHDIIIKKMANSHYIAGEETALISYIENGFAYPRQKPPFPVQSGLFNKPTLVHNVETMANISYIARNGIQEFCATGTEKYKGTKLFCISGDVKNPGVFELPFGTSLHNLLNDIDGSLFAILPGFANVIYADECKTLNLDYDSFRYVNSDLGTGNIVVFNSPKKLKAYLKRCIMFLANSGCQQCLNCRAICKITKKILDTEFDVNEWNDISKNVMGLSRCPLMNSLIDMFNNYMAVTI